MADSVAVAEAPRHLLRSETRPSVAKAHLRKPETADFRAEIGACLDRARFALGWNLDELATALKRDARQVKRWITGDERVQMDAVLSVPELHAEFVIALAGAHDALRVSTTIVIERRRA